jgi:hypothetical protein
VECAVLLVCATQGLLQYFSDLLRGRLALRLTEGRLYCARVCPNALDCFSVCDQGSLALCLFQRLSVVLGVLAGAH